MSEVIGRDDQARSPSTSQNRFTKPDLAIRLLAYDKDPTVHQFVNMTTTQYTSTLDSLLTQPYTHSNTKYYLVRDSKHVMLQNLLIGSSAGVTMVDFVGRWVSGNAWSSAIPP